MATHTLPLPLMLLLLMPAVSLALALGAENDRGAGTATNSSRYLRRRRPSSDIFSVALRFHDSSSTSLSLPMQQRRARADNLLSDYVHECTSFLLSQNVLADGIISQDEFVDFMLLQCQAEDICPNGKKLQFEQLDVSAQLKFIMGICSHEDFADRSNCIYDLHDQWLESKLFGLKTNESGNTQSLVHNMCTEVYVDAVKMGFTRTTEPTSNPVPTLTPSRSMKPSSSPSNHSTLPAAIITFAPTRMADKSSPLPMSAAPTNSEPGIDEPSTSPSGQFIPSVLPPPEIDVEAKPPSDHDSLSRDTIIIAAALTLALVVGGSLYSLYNRPPRTVTTKETINDQWDTTFSPVSLACLGIRQSISSSPCSERDHRFINIYSEQGSPIPQFNPSTANAVVIGTVSIGSSSFSSDLPPSGADLLTNEYEPECSSGRRSFVLDASANSRLRHHQKRQTLTGLSPSVHSCQSMPLTLSCGKKLQGQYPIDANNISFGDWKAVSYMSSEFCCGTSATSAAAATAHNNFFFDLFTEKSTLENVSCHSLPVIPRQFSFASSDSDLGLPSVLSESFFKAESSYIQSQSIAICLQSSPSVNTDTTPRNVLVPWRNQEVEFSDSNQSDMSDSDSSSVTFATLPLRRRRRYFGPSKRLFAAFRKKTRAKFTLKSKHYQHLQGVELEEDPSILSMSNSYLSETDVAARQIQQTPSNQLGTFAAAVLPLSLGEENGPTMKATSASNCFDQTDIDLEANGVVDGDKSDSASAFSRSQFESSKGWSSCSRLNSSSSSDSSSAGGKWHSGDLDCSFAEAIAPDKSGTKTDVEGKIDLSQICSQSESSEPSDLAFDVSESSGVSDEEDDEDTFVGTIYDLSNGSSTVSTTSQLPHLVSYSSEDISFPSDEQSPLHGLSVLNNPERADNVAKIDDCPVKPASKDEASTTDECAAHVIAWAIKNETKKLEGSIPL